MKYTRKSARKSARKSGRKSVRTKHKTRKNKSRMMKRGGAKSKRSTAIFKNKLKDKIDKLKSGINFTRQTRDGFEKERDSCHNKLNKLKEENKILENEKKELELKLENKSRMMKMGGAASERSPLLSTETINELEKQIKKLENEQTKVKNKRNNFRDERDVCYDELDKLTEKKKMLKEKNKNLKREIRNLEENNVIVTKLSARNLSNPNLSNPNLSNPNLSNRNLSARNLSNPDNLFNREFYFENGMTPSEEEKMEENINRAIEAVINVGRQNK